MESFFGSENTSSSDYMDEEGEEEKDSSSSSDEEVQRNKRPSPLLQSPATSKKQRKKLSKSKESKFLSESEIVPSGPGVPLPDTRVSSSLNVLRERVKQNNMVDPLPIFLPISVIECPPVDAHTGKRSLEVSAIIEQHVHNLKFKMKNKPNAIVLPLLVLVDRQQCPTKHSWIKANAESYTYWVLGGTHSLIAKQELAAEYEHVDSYETAMCWVYAGLTNEEAKVLALDHNIDSDFCLEMSFIQKIRFFHNEWVDTLKLKKKGGCGASQKPNTKQYDNYFQLAFRDGECCDLQEEIFKLHEQGKLKGQKLSKSQGKGVSKEDSPKPIPEDMKITPWRQVQGIRERLLIIAKLSRVKDGSVSLEQMGEEFERFNKDPRVAIKQIPLDFEQFLSRCHLERRRKQQPQSFEITLGLSLYVPDNVDESPSHWCVHEGRVEEMSTFVTPRSYTLAIAEAPYGFCVPNSVNDDVKYGVFAYKKVIEAFTKVTTCDSWSLVFFHAHDQFTAVQKAFTDSNMTCQMLTWIKPNIHGYKLDRLSWACEFAAIGFYSSLGVQSKRSYNFTVKPNRTNVFERPGVCKKFKHTGADLHGVINPYQKPQLLMMDLIELLSMRGEWVMDLFAGTDTTIVSALKRGQIVIAVECDPLQVKFIMQRVTALKELPDEFQEVEMKSMASDPRFSDASREPQPPIGSEKVGEIVDLVDFEPDNIEVEEQASDTPLQITSMGEETRNEEEEDLPIQALNSSNYVFMQKLDILM
ncbi:hypothetical protein L7F22_012702 [Adiantum nelumboides]|nr:hypothetical protein [Adiantum nelumboides]